MAVKDICFVSHIEKFANNINCKYASWCLF